MMNMSEAAQILDPDPNPVPMPAPMPMPVPLPADNTPEPIKNAAREAKCGKFSIVLPTKDRSQRASKRVATN